MISLYASVKYRLDPYLKRFYFPNNKGFCPICKTDTVFYEYAEWLRDNYLCEKCKSIPRNRALVRALDRFYPGWEEVMLHESSPGGPFSEFLQRTSKNYSGSHYYDNVPRGEYLNGYRSEDLSALTFDDNTFDLFITSDVFEHVLEPGPAFKEIARVLKPGGAHIFVMPWYPALEHSVQRASLQDGKINYLVEPIYHGNPISEKGSLVTNDWGRDFCSFIYSNSGMFTTIYLEKDRHFGLEAEFLEVFISKKPS